MQDHTEQHPKPKRAGDSTDNLLSEDPESPATIRTLPSPRISWKKRLIAFASLLVLISIFGLLVFLAFPRKPTISLTSFELNEDLPSEPDKDGQLMTNWIAKVSVKSPNYMDIGVKELDVKAYVPSHPETPVGFGKAQDITIKRRDKTIIELGFKVPVYQPSSGKPSLIEECMNYQQAKLLIVAEIDLNLLHWTGKKIKTSMNKTVDCKLPQLLQIANKFTKNKFK